MTTAEPAQLSRTSCSRAGGLPASDHNHPTAPPIQMYVAPAGSRLRNDRNIVHVNPTSLSA